MLFSEKILIELIKNLPNCGLTIFCDNYFSSIKIIKKLKNQNMNFLGVIRPTRIGIPELIKDMKIEKKEYGKICNIEEEIFLYKYNDRKMVYFLSTLIFSDEDIVKNFQKNKKYHI